MADRSGEFVWLHTKDRKIARFLGFDDPPVIAVVDSDGAVYGEAQDESIEEINRVLNHAAEYYQEREIIWTPSYGGGMSSAKDRERLALVAFGAEGEGFATALKQLEDRTLIKYHGRLIFIKQGLDSEAAREHKVTEGTSIVLLDPAKDKGKQELGRVTGKTAAEFKPVIKAALQQQSREKSE